MKKIMMFLFIACFLSILSFSSNAAIQTIENDTVWKDTQNNEILAQGGCIFQSDSTYHWFGPALGGPGDYSFTAINHYTSTDLENWTKQAPAITPGTTGIPFYSGNWVGRPWILYNAPTLKYVMLVELGGSGDGIRNQYTFLTSDSLNGPWKYISKVQKLPDATGTLYSLGDLGAFQDTDGNAYIMYTYDKGEANGAQAIVKLDPKNFTRPLTPEEGGLMADFYGMPWPEGVREAAGIVKRGSTYYYFTSTCRGWKSSNTMYRTASSMAGPWSAAGNVLTNPQSDDSFNTQHDFVLPVTGSAGTSYIYCGDRWSNYTGVGIGRYAWFPLTFDAKGVPTINGLTSWSIDTASGLWSSTNSSPVNLAVNSGFEVNGGFSQTPDGWSSAGTNVESDYCETSATAHGGAYQGTHYRSSDYEVYTYQTIAGLTNGIYTLKAWVKSSGKQTSCYMNAKDFGGTEIKINMPSGNAWTQITINHINVTNGKCTFGFYSKAGAGQWCNFDDIEFTKDPSGTIGYKISGYIRTDTDGALKSGFKIGVTGISYTAVTDNNGYFEITNVPSSSYNISISKDSYLHRTFYNISVADNLKMGTETEPLELWVGDIAIDGFQDQAVNMSDIMEVAKAFNSIKGDSRYRIEYDLNLDQAVNMSDIMMIAKNFNKTSSDYPPFAKV